MIAAVIFDMDGLMFDTETLSVKGWIAAGEEQGFVITEEMVFKVFGLSPEGLSQFWAQQLGESFNYAKAMERRITYMKNYVEKNGVPLKPGLLELLSYLKKRNYPFAIASSSQKKMIQYYIELAGISPYFKHIISGEDVKNSKPAPDIFLEAAKMMGAKPEECMVFEDSINGVLGAHGAGMKAVMVPDKVQPDEKTRAYLYAELKGLEEGIELLKREA